MKKFISMLLVLVVLASMGTVAYAAPINHTNIKMSTGYEPPIGYVTANTAGVYPTRGGGSPIYVHSGDQFWLIDSSIEEYNGVFWAMIEIKSGPAAGYFGYIDVSNVYIP